MTSMKCLTCGGGLRLNHAAGTLCRDCSKGDQSLAVPLYCFDCCLRDNKCANCGSPIRITQEIRREEVNCAREGCGHAESEHGEPGGECWHETAREVYCDCHGFVSHAPRDKRITKD